MEPRIAESLSYFDTISLDALNTKAAMLERLDQKYIIPATRLRPAFDAFRDIFEVLEIDENGGAKVGHGSGGIVLLRAA
ncbi:hypothetical protein [Cypionkella sp. TWP1-2-1b2]|uniref:hypothetical protein n=1 Tax=Cypionkella sp. TWP1-2-1b2 TaxID=2804675 RepID=UPI003CE6A41D